MTVLSVGCADNSQFQKKVHIPGWIHHHWPYLGLQFTYTVCGVSGRLEVEGSQQLLLQTSVGQRVKCEASPYVLPCRALSVGSKNSAVVFKFLSLQVKKTMNFLDLRGVIPGERSWFQSWFRLAKGQAPLPRGMEWNLWRLVTTSAQFAELQHGLDLSYMKIWSQDWKATEHALPWDRSAGSESSVQLRFFDVLRGRQHRHAVLRRYVLRRVHHEDGRVREGGQGSVVLRLL